MSPYFGGQAGAAQLAMHQCEHERVHGGPRAFRFDGLLKERQRLSVPPTLGQCPAEVKISHRMRGIVLNRQLEMPGRLA